MKNIDKDKLLLRIGDARFSIQIKEKPEPMDSKIDNLLADFADILWKQIPYKTAHWIFDEIKLSWMKCSNCCVSQTSTSCFSYCPNCGAEMSEEPTYAKN